MTSNPDGSVSPEQMLERAHVIACHLLRMPETEKDSALKQIKQDNAVLYALVKAALQEIRACAAPKGKRKEPAPWLRQIMGDMGILPRPEDNLGWGI